MSYESGLKTSLKMLSSDLDLAKFEILPNVLTKITFFRDVTQFREIFDPAIVTHFSTKALMHPSPCLPPT